MGFADRVKAWWESGKQPLAITAGPVGEAAKPGALVPVPTAAQIRRSGYEYGIPLASASTSQQVAATSERQQILGQLHQAYLTCTPVAGCVDLIARTVTAGGLAIVEDDEIPEGQTPPEPPPVARLRRLMRFTNPTEDLVQVLRNVVTDLMLFGDAYIEVIEFMGEPVALYMLDATTMTVLADQHGQVTGYRQDVDGVRSAPFKPEQVIHISLDAPRGGLYGVSPAQKALLPVTSWLFAEATLKECFRRGDPPRLHVDLAHLQDNDVQRWREQYRVFNLGPRAVGEPVVTTGGGQVGVLDGRKVTDYLEAIRQLRDEIISVFGVSPAKLGIIETGNLGGGTGEAQHKTFMTNTVIPIAALVLEKLNYHLLQSGFGIVGWHLEFEEIDYRDSVVVENIRKIRVEAGVYTTNRYRDEIGEPPIEGGDAAYIITRQGPVAVLDMEAMSKASIANRAAPMTAAGVNGYVPELPDSDTHLAAGLPDRMAGFKTKPTAKVPADLLPPTLDAPKKPYPRESALESDQRRLSASWEHAYRARRKQALRELPPVEQSEGRRTS